MADYTWPVPPLQSVFLVTFRMEWCGQQLMNTYHYLLTENAANNSVEGLYDHINLEMDAANGMLATHKELRDANCNLTQMTVQMVWPQRYVAKSFVKNLAGTVAGANDTPNLHATVARRAVGGTRKDSGHVHIPIPIDATVFVNGVLTAAFLVKLTAHAAKMDTDLFLDTSYKLVPCLFNKDNVPAARPIGTTAAKSEVRVSRRRTVGLGI